MQSVVKRGEKCPHCGRYNDRNISVDGIIVRDGKILLILRGAGEEVGKWAFPGGTLDWDETLEEAVLREVKEETGLDTKITRFFGTYSHPQRTAVRTITAAYILQVTGGDISIQQSEIRDAKWFDLEDLPEHIAFDHRNVIEDYKRSKGQLMKRGKDYIGVGIGAVIINREGKIFLSKRGEAAQNEQGKWECPGGALEFGEDFKETIVREIQEEFGFVISPIEPLEAYNHRIPADRQHWVALAYVCKIVSGKPEIKEKHKSAQIGWFTRDEMREMELTLSTQKRLAQLDEKYGDMLPDLYT